MDAKLSATGGDAAAATASDGDVDDDLGVDLSALGAFYFINFFKYLNSLI